MERLGRVPQHTRSLHQVFLLAVAVAANVTEGEEKVMLLVQLSRQLYLYLKARKKKTTQIPGVRSPDTDKGLCSRV